MRIYEFAQQHNVSNKDLIEKLKSHGFEVKSHMTVLDNKAIAYLEGAFSHSSKEVKKDSKSTKNVLKQDVSTHSTIKKETNKNNDLKGATKGLAVPIQASDNEKIDDFVEVQSIKKSDTHMQMPHEGTNEIELVPRQMSIMELAEAIKKPVTDIIVTLLRWGIVATKNQVISQDLVVRLADHYTISIAKNNITAEPMQAARIREGQGSHFQKKAPVVVVVGHVDHGKTTLLDYIRKTRVALKEKGGITQHLGAYEATTSHGNIVFLDTPGHEAFIKIRQRGIKVADIVILIVAADDGVMPQTVEAIKYALAMKVPIVVAVNKIDKVDPSRLDVIKRQLNQHGIIVEDWGGDVICVPISAKTGEGIDRLLEMLILQAEMMELKADIDVPAYGYILESSMEKGRGYVATLISQSGVIKIGDYILCGTTSGHISSLTDSHGKRVKQAYPAIPIQVAGFDERPDAGDFFQVISKNDYLKAKSSGSDKGANAYRRLTYENGINVIVKADNHSSLEAIVEGIDRLSKKLKKGFNILRYDVGNVNEGDVEFAFNTGARIICFNTKAESNAQSLADNRKVSITSYGIIYKLLEDLDALAETLKDVETVRTKIGQALVLRVFDIKKVGVIAGSIIKDGRFTRDGYAVIWRGKTKIGEGKITSLQRDKKAVKEIATGFECAFMVDNFSDWAEGDQVECFVDVIKK